MGGLYLSRELASWAMALLSVWPVGGSDRCWSLPQGLQGESLCDVQSVGTVAQFGGEDGASKAPESRPAAAQAGLGCNMFLALPPEPWHCMPKSPGLQSPS